MLDGLVAYGFTLDIFELEVDLCWYPLVRWYDLVVTGDVSL